MPDGKCLFNLFNYITLHSQNLNTTLMHPLPGQPSIMCDSLGKALSFLPSFRCPLIESFHKTSGLWAPDPSQILPRNESPSLTQSCKWWASHSLPTGQEFLPGSCCSDSHLADEENEALTSEVTSESHPSEEGAMLSWDRWGHFWGSASPGESKFDLQMLKTLPHLAFSSWHLYS